MKKILPFLIALGFSSQVAGKEVTPEMACRAYGGAVLHARHTLDICIQHKKQSESQVLEAWRPIARVYPRIDHEFSGGGELSSRAKSVANGLPYDFSDGGNDEVLTGICRRAMANLGHYVVDPDWQKALACWR